jgi:hypothetical protein
MTRLAIWLWDVAPPVLLAADQSSARSSGSWGKWVFAATLALLLVWLIFMPRRLIGQAPGVPWWRSVRLWAIVVCVMQLAIYVIFA